MILTGASPVTTFLVMLSLKCSDPPCGGQAPHRKMQTGLTTGINLSMQYFLESYVYFTKWVHLDEVTCEKWMRMDI